MNYFITGLNSEYYKDFEADWNLAVRTFGYFPSLDSAIECIESNYGKMDEAGYFDYLILESIGPGIHPMVSQVILFKWENEKWNEVKMWPDWLPKGTTNFVLG